MRAIAGDRLPGVVNSYVGSNRRRWRTGLPTFESVRYERVWPGTDLVFHGNQGQLEYDFVVAPQSDPARIALRIGGGARPRLDRSGRLVVRTPAGRFVQRRPVIYQNTKAGRSAIDGRFVLEGRNVRFDVGAYDRSRPLVIDPVILYSTFNGGTGSDSALDVATDAAGRAVVVGETFSSSFPLMSAADSTFAGSEAFVTKLSADGSARLFSTYLGGALGDSGEGVAVSQTTGLVAVTGSTSSQDFPTTAGAAQPARAGAIDAFVATLTEAGALSAATYLGGTGNDQGHNVALRAERVQVVGTTASTDFPGAPDLVGTSDGFFVAMAPDLSGHSTSVRFGGSGADSITGIGHKPDGSVVLAGTTTSTDLPVLNAAQPSSGGGGKDAFVAAFAPLPPQRQYVTYHGGDGLEEHVDVSVGADGRVSISGTTSSTNYPATVPGSLGGPSDAFAARFQSDGTRQNSRRLGGADRDTGGGIAVTPNGETWVVGTDSGQPFADAMVWRLGADFAVADTLRLQGTTDDGTDQASAVATDGSGDAYVVGGTDSDDFPTLNAVQPTNRDYDAFITKIAPSPAPTASPTETPTATPSPSPTAATPPPSAPAAAFDGPAGNVPPGATVAFDASASTGEALTYAWDLDGDGTFEASGVRVERAYATPGAVTATLRVTDGAGRTDVASRQLTVATPGTWRLRYSPALPKAGQKVDFEFERTALPGRSATGQPGTDAATHRWNFGEDDDPDGDGKGKRGGRTTGNLDDDLRTAGAVFTEDRRVGHSYGRAGSYNMQVTAPGGDGTGVLMAQSIPVGAPKSRKASGQLFAGFSLPASVPVGQTVFVTDMSRLGPGGKGLEGPTVSYAGGRPQNDQRDRFAAQGSVEFKVDGKPCGAPCRTAFGGSVPLTFDTPGVHTVTMTARAGSARASASGMGVFKPVLGTPPAVDAQVSMEFTISEAFCPHPGGSPILLAIGGGKTQHASVRGDCFYATQYGKSKAFETSGTVTLPGTGLEIQAAAGQKAIIVPSTGAVFSSKGSLKLRTESGATVDERNSYLLNKDLPLKLSTAASLKLGKLKVTQASIRFLGGGAATAKLQAVLPKPFNFQSVAAELPAAQVATAELTQDQKIAELPPIPLGPASLEKLSLYYRPNGGKPLFTAGGLVDLPTLGLKIDAVDNYASQDVRGLRLNDDGSFKAAGAELKGKIEAGFATFHSIAGSISVDPFRLEGRVLADVLPKYVAGADVIHGFDACVVIVAADGVYAGDRLALCNSQAEYNDHLKAHETTCQFLKDFSNPSAKTLKEFNCPPSAEFKEKLLKSVSFVVPNGGGTAFDFTGTGKILNLVPFKLGVRVTSDNGLKFRGSTHYDLLNEGMIIVDAYVSGHIKTKQQWEIAGGAQVCAPFIDDDLCYGGDVLVTNKGVGGCAYLPYYLPNVGGTFTWATKELDIIWSSCQISDVRKKIGVIAMASAAQMITGRGAPTAAMAATEHPVTLQKGAKSVIAVTGVGAQAPRVDLLDPQGKAVVVDDGRAVQDRKNGVLRASKLGKTFLFVDPPTDGQYKLVAREGSIASVEQGESFPKPQINARVTGTGTVRKLAYQAVLPPGQTATFYEEGEEVATPLVQTGATARASSLQTLTAQISARRGRKAFRPAAPDGDKRQIVAVIADADGTPRARIPVTTFRAPRAPKPPRVKAVRLKVGRNTLAVRWTPDRAGGEQQLRIALGDGTTVTRTLKRGARRYTYRNYPVTAGATVTIAARGPRKVFGPSAKAKVSKRKAPKAKPIRI